MATQGKNKGKKKGVPLGVFLAADEKAAPTGFSFVNTRTPLSWAESMENEDIDDTFTLNFKHNDNNKVLLPTAPKSTRGPDIDMARVPTQPPFKAYIGNLSYEITEQDITKYFAKLSIKEVRLVRENGRLKGFGYAEFYDRQSLIDALAFSGENFKNRPIKVGLPGERDSNDSHSREPREERQDRTAGDWRAAREPREESQPLRDNGRDTRNGAFEHSNSDRGMQRTRTNDNSYDGVDHGGYGNRNRGFEGNDRGFERSNDRNFDRNDRGFDRQNNRYGDRRVRTFEPSYDRYDDRSERPDSRGGYGRRNDDRRVADADSKYSDRRSDRGSDRGFDRNDRRRDYASGFESRRDERASPSPPPVQPQEPPKERRKLNLMPRTIPVENNTIAANSAIFGEAKPVDTAVREKQIEEKLLKEKEEIEKKARESGESDDRIRRISSGSNASGTGRSRKGSESGPSSSDFGRVEYSDAYRNDSTRSLGRQRKYSDRNSDRGSDRGSVGDRESAPKQILQRRKDPPPLNSSQGLRYQSNRPRDAPRDGPRGGNPRRGNGNREDGTFIRRGENRDRDREYRAEPYRPPPQQSKLCDDENNKAYTSANKFAHLHDDIEDNDDGGASE